MIAERWDKGYGHFTTRQNIQFNWPKLRDVPDILEALADVEMHAIQTSGNCIRNVTADHFAGAAADEIEDPRPTAELLRQWSTDHPEFLYLPRKFKIAITGAPNDRAVTKSHDIGLRMVRDDDGAPGYEVSIGGGLGRTPMIGKVVREFLPKADLLPYLEAILHVYNLSGRRDNKYKARLKILVHEETLEVVRERVEAAFLANKAQMRPVNPELVAEIEAAFAPPAFEARDRAAAAARRRACAPGSTPTSPPHKLDHYAIVTVSLKPIGGTPGDATAEQMRLVADLAEAYGHDEIRVSHEQNLILPHVPRRHLPAVYARLKAAGLATANVGLISDIIACPGMDYCALATARSIPVAQEIAETLRRPRPAARHRAAEDQDLGLHQRLRPPPRRPYRHPRARPGGGGELPDHPRRRRHRDRGDRREGRARLRLRRGRAGGRAADRGLSRPAAGAGRDLPRRPTAGSASSRSRRRSIPRRRGPMRLESRSAPGRAARPARRRCGWPTPAARPQDVLAGVLAEFPGEVALVSSFGAEAAVLLHMVAEIDRDLPVLMIDTLMLFEETLDYQRELVGSTSA